MSTRRGLENSYHRRAFHALGGAVVDGQAKMARANIGRQSGETGMNKPIQADTFRTMEPAQFAAEYYRRMDAHSGEDVRRCNRTWEEVSKHPGTLALAENYRAFLPADKNARILDIGFGTGLAIAAFVSLGYTNVEGANFSADARRNMMNWSPGVRAIREIETDIGSFLRDRGDRYDFILMSHVIEHIPKTQLFHILDAVYAALNRGGTLLVRTPNMEGPRPSSGRYVNITHELGFTGASIGNVLCGCSFENITFIKLGRLHQSPRQRLVSMVRWLLEQQNRFMHRMFGAYNRGGQYGDELILTAQRLK